jgi:integrase/recombinase XerD
VVLSQSEVKAIFEATKNLKHKSILMTIYAAGLRVSEAANLKVVDIDSKNMQIFIHKGKGKKDRYAILSKANVEILREYWRQYHPKEFLFSGRCREDAISSRSIQKIFEQARDKAE